MAAAIVALGVLIASRIDPALIRCRGRFPHCRARPRGSTAAAAGRSPGPGVRTVGAAIPGDLHAAADSLLAETTGP